MDIAGLENPRKEIEDALKAGDLAKLLRLNGLLHGHYCPGSAMGVKAAARAVKELRTRSTGMEEVVAIVETNSCFADGVQLVTGCTLGNGSLIYRDYGKTAVTLAHHSGDAVRVAAKKGGASPLDIYPSAAPLFRKVMQEGGGTESEKVELKKLWVDIAFKMLDMPDENFFSITSSRIEVPVSSRSSASTMCAVCGENSGEHRARLKNGKPVCLSCSGQPYYQLAAGGLSLISG